MRALSPRYPSHRWLGLAMLVAGVVAWVRLPAGSLGEHLGAAAVGSVTVLVAWALARELDPDQPLTAWLATVVAVGFVAVHTHLRVDLAGGFALLLAARIALGSTGLLPRWGDIVIVAGVCWLAADHTPGLVAAAGLVLAVSEARPLGDAPRVARGRHIARLTAIAGAIAMGVSVAVAGWPLAEWPEPPRWIPLATLGLVGGVVATIRCTVPRTEADYRRVVLGQRRLRMARIVVTLTLAAALVIAGPGAVSALAPSWFALAAAGVVAVVPGRRT